MKRKQQVCSVCIRRAMLAHPRGRACKDCGGPVTGKGNRLYCETCAPRARQRAVQDKNYRRRAACYRVAYELIDRLTVFERDRWTCGLCGDPIDPDVNYPDEWSASLDHVTPLSKGGPHTYTNVQAAHLWCNVSKGNDETFDLHAA